jgi:hypothetical protein
MIECKNCEHLFWDEIRKKRYGTDPQRRPFCSLTDKQIFHIWMNDGRPNWCPLKYTKWT